MCWEGLAIKKLSEYQKYLLGMLRANSSLGLWTTEGNGYRAWLGTEQEELQGVRVRTVEVLHELGKIELEEGNYREGYYKYILT